MDSNSALIDFAKAYVRACIRRDFDALADAIYPGDLDKLKNNVVWCAQAMAQIEPDATFLSLFGGELDLEDLRVLSPRQFFQNMLKGSMGGTDGGAWQDIANSIRIGSIQRPSESAAIVEYSLEVTIEDTTEMVENEMELQFIGERWFVMLRPGVRRVSEQVRLRLDDFQKRKARDQPNQDLDCGADDLEAFELWGYRDSNKRVVIEPRFAQAGKFSKGLAPVRIFKKWGYISAAGDLVIKALYDRAKPFSEGLAAVALEDDAGEILWGYVGLDGRLQIKTRFETAGAFNNGVAKVSMSTRGQKRAFLIDTNGTEHKPRVLRN